MDLTTLIAYVFNCAVCTTIGTIFLLTPIQKDVQGKVDSFSKTRLCLAASALIEALTSLLYISRIINGVPHLSLDHFTSPLFIYFAICIDMTAIIYLLHGKQPKLRTSILYVTPVLLVWLTHIILFIPDYGLTFSAKAYNEFITTKPAIYTCYALYAVFVVETAYILKSVGKQIIRFRQHIDNYCSGKSRSQSHWLIAVVISIVIYYIISIIDLFTSDPMWDSSILWILSLVIIVNSIAFIMCRNIYWEIRPAFADNDNTPTTAATTDNATDADKAQHSSDESKQKRKTDAMTQRATFDSNSIDDIVNEWIRRDDKPYLKESITITQVAEQMGLNTRLLSNYINYVKGRNFNAWINFLKVQETKVVLLADRTLPLSDIAYRMGFADLASMSRIFKQIEGMPPSVYRQRN